MVRGAEIEQIRRLVQPVEDGGRAAVVLARGFKRILPLIEEVAAARWGGAEIDTPQFNFSADGTASLVVTLHPATDSRQHVVVAHTLAPGVTRQLTVTGREQTFDGGLPQDRRERKQLQDALDAAFDSPQQAREPAAISPED